MAATLNRREFAQVTGILGAMAGHGLGNGAPAAPDQLPGRITELILANDVCALVMLSPGLPSAVKAAIGRQGVFARAGTLLRPGGDWSFKLDAAEKQGPKRNRSEARLALGIGSIIGREAEAFGRDMDAEGRLHRDAFLLREIQFATTGRDVAGVQQAQAAELFTALGRRVLLGIHTFIPDAEDVNGWIERLIRWHDAWAAFAGRLARAYCEPDAATLQRSVIRAKFYDRADRAILAAKSISSGPPTTRQALESSLASVPQSLYGRSLLRAYHSAVSDLLRAG